MAAQAALPPGLTSDDIHYILESLDVELDSIILWALTSGKLHSLWSNSLMSEPL